MSRSRIRVCGSVVLALWAIVVLSCAERDVEAGEEPLALAAPSETETLHFEDVRSVEVSLFPGSGVLVSGAFCRHSPAIAWADRIAESGRCRLLHRRPVERLSAANLDTGVVTVEVAGASVRLAGPVEAPPCFRTPIADLPELRAGDRLRVWSTGGRDVPAFDLEVVAPDVVTVVGPTAGRSLRVGEPWSLAWIGVEHGLFVEIRGKLDGTDLVASCRGLSGSDLTLPIDLTALWPERVGKVDLAVGVERVATTGGEAPVKLLVRRVDAGGLALATVAAR